MFSKSKNWNLLSEHEMSLCSHAYCSTLHIFGFKDWWNLPFWIFHRYHKGLSWLVTQPKSVLAKRISAIRGMQGDLDTSDGRKTRPELININKTLKKEMFLKRVILFLLLFSKSKKRRYLQEKRGKPKYEIPRYLRLTKHRCVFLILLKQIHTFYHP